MKTFENQKVFDHLDKRITYPKPEPDFSSYNIKIDLNK